MKSSLSAVGFVLSFALALCVAESDWSDLEIEFEDVMPREFMEQEVHEGRIIGGEQAVPGQFPYQAGLRMSSGSWCGGVLVDKEWVLTAAHCARNQNFIDVYLGAQNIRNLTEEGRVNIRVPSENIVVHKAYSSSAIANDIAILRLPEAINITNRIKPIALPSYSDAAIDFAGIPAVISGWGKNANDAATITDEMQYTAVTIQPHHICQYFFSSARLSNICTETIYGRGTCNGDSGGPMAISRSGQYVLLGLTSFGSSRGCVACFPSVFVRVTYYLDWIAANSNIEIKP